MAGSAAAVLIGLIFVVVSLMDDRPRSMILFGSRLYMGPIVLHMSFVLVLSAAALAPRMGSQEFAGLLAAPGLWGAGRGIYSLWGILRRLDRNEIHWTDPWYYGAPPMVLHLALLACAFGSWRGAVWTPYGVAATITAVIVLGVRNEWDLVTWLAPKDAPTTPDGAAVTPNE